MNLPARDRMHIDPATNDTAREKISRLSMRVRAPEVGNPREAAHVKQIVPEQTGRSAISSLSKGTRWKQPSNTKPYEVSAVDSHADLREEL
jgi:hypothetical protein